MELSIKKSKTSSKTYRKMLSAIYKKTPVTYILFHILLKQSFALVHIAMPCEEKEIMLELDQIVTHENSH